METRRHRARKKLLEILSRSALEELSGVAAPWHHDRSSLIAASLVNWVQDDVEYEVKKLLKEAQSSIQYGKEDPNPEMPREDDEEIPF